MTSIPRNRRVLLSFTVFGRRFILLTAKLDKPKPRKRKEPANAA